MAFVINDRVRETTNIAGLADFTLQGTTPGFESFGVGIGDANSTYYAVFDAASGQWEVGIGTYTALTDTLSRDTILTSSASNAKVDFTAGIKTVWCTQPAYNAVLVAPDNSIVSMNPSARVPNSLLQNSAITINGVPIALGAEGTFELNTLTIGSGLTGGSYNGGGPVTIAVDTGVVLTTAALGVTVQPYDAGTLTTASIGVTVQAYDATALNGASIGSTVQPQSDRLTEIAALAPTAGQFIVWDAGGFWTTSAPGGGFLVPADIGVTVQAYDADTAKTDVAQTFTAPQRGSIVTDNDLTFDLSASNNFVCTPTGSGTLTFINIASGAGQSGFIKLINGANYAISAAATTKITAAALAAISATGTYVISYFCDGIDVFVSATENLA